MVEQDNVTKNLLNDNRHGGAGGVVIVPAGGGGPQSSGHVASSVAPVSILKTQIVPAQPKTLQHLPKRPAVDLAFHDLTYRVKEGNRSSKYLTSHSQSAKITKITNHKSKRLNKYITNAHNSLNSWPSNA